jgi:lysophospholipase L1-like esterase
MDEPFDPLLLTSQPENPEEPESSFQLQQPDEPDESSFVPLTAPFFPGVAIPIRRRVAPRPPQPGLVGAPFAAAAMPFKTAQAPVVTPMAPVVTPMAPVVTPMAPVVTPMAPVVTPMAAAVTPAPAPVSVPPWVKPPSDDPFSTPGAAESTAAGTADSAVITLKQCYVQSKGGITSVNDPTGRHGTVIKFALDTRLGVKTENGAGPRSECRVKYKLVPDATYVVTFKVMSMQDHNNTFFQVMDDATIKAPGPRLKLVTDGGGNYVANYRTSATSGDPKGSGKLGSNRPDIGKWVEFRVEYHRHPSRGSIVIYKDGRLVHAARNIATMYASAKDAWFKFGQYKKNASATSTLYFADFVIQKVGGPGARAQVSAPKTAYVPPKGGLSDKDKKRQRSMKHNAEVVSRAAAMGAKPLDFVLLGDSITANIHLNYADLWRQLMGANAEAVGVGGDDVAQLASRLVHGTVFRAAPRVIGVLIGINDVKNARKDPVDKVEWLLSYLRSRYPASRLLLLGMLPNRHVDVRPFNARYAVVASRRGAAYSDCGRDIDPSAKADMADGTHPGRAGYVKLVTCLAQRVASLSASLAPGPSTFSSTPTIMPSKPTTAPPAQPAQPAQPGLQGLQSGPVYTGRLLADLALADLRLPDGGVWGGRPGWRKSGLATFQGQQVLRVVYEKGSGTSHDKGGVGGFDITAKPAGIPGTSLLLSFEVYFERGWHFSRGGKIGGLFVGHGHASGKRHSPTGSSHRIMWKQDGGAISYIYPPSDLAQEDPRLRASGSGIAYFGDAFGSGTLKVGAWNRVDLGLKLNGFAQGRPLADGVALLSVNGVTRRVNNIRWRRSPDLLITSVDINTFFGGPDPAVVDCVAYYRNFKLFELQA